MPVTESILNNDWLGPIYKRGFKKGKDRGLEKGLEKGREEGREQGRLLIVRRLAEKRFGALPTWAESRLSALTAPELEDLSLRLLDVQSLDELLPR